MRPKSKYFNSVAIGTLVAMLSKGNPKYVAKSTWKPKFSENELIEIRSLPKKQREQKVKSLRAQYLQQAGGIFAVNA